MNLYALSCGTLGGLLCVATARAQAPTLSSVSPLPHAVSVSRNTPVVATFSQPLIAASAGALRVFSSRRGGLRGGGVATVAGRTLSFFPTAYDFPAGETVQLSVTRGVAGAGGPLAQPWVSQFTVAAGGTGQGYFGGGRLVAVTSGLQEIATGDVDGDGDLDLVTTSYSPAGTVSVSLNNGAGDFTGGPTVGTGLGTRAVALADVDNDGDLDLLATVAPANAVAVSFNNGTGTFGSAQNVAVPNGPEDLALGDLDGDGDLDLVAVGTGGTVSTRFNNGAGSFGGGQSLPIAAGGYSVALADLDADGDLDFVTGGFLSPDCPVFYNNGGGTFVAGQPVALTSSAYEVALADMDADGDADLVVAQSNSSTVTLFPNSGGGTFGLGLSLPIGPYGTPSGLVVGDVNGDGRPDIVAQESANTVAVLLNTGGGTFGAAPSVTVGQVPRRLLLADLDDDYDLDLLTADQVDNTVGVRFNQPGGPLATTFGTVPAMLTATPNPATGQVRLTLPPAATSAELLDALGRSVRQVPAPAGTATLDVTGLPPGLYLLHAAGHTARLVVE